MSSDEQKDESTWLVVKPIGMPRKMTTWKSGLKFQPEVSSNKESHTSDIGTTSRLRKVGASFKKSKGSFKKKNKISDAPNLLSVVSATPEMKERAKAHAKARQSKIEEYRKFKTSRTIVSKPPLKQPKSQWQNMITKTSQAKKSKTSSLHAKKTKSKSMGDIAIADWKAAYQGILSPTSGNHKYVARRDLVATEKVTSPKKKARAKSRSASFTFFSQTLPLVGIDNYECKSKDDGDVHRIENMEQSSMFSKTSIKKTPLSMNLLSYDDDVEQNSFRSLNSTATPKARIGSRPGFSDRKLPVIVSPISEKLEPDEKSDVSQIGLCTKNVTGSVGPQSESAEPRVMAEQRGEQGFIDWEEFDELNETMDVEDNEPHAVTENQKCLSVLHETVKSVSASAFGDTAMDPANSQHTNKTPPPISIPKPPKMEEEKTPAKVTPRMSKKLILEFSMPALTGDASSGDEDDVGLEVPVDVLSFGDISSVGSWPSIESEDSYDTRMNKLMQRWVDVHGGDFNNCAHENDVQLDDNVLDHIVLAAPDLEKAMEQFHHMTGIMPSHVGPLQGLGAQTAHVGLDNGRFIEILAPDDDDPGPLGDDLRGLEEGVLTPYHYAIRSSEVSRLIEGYVYDVLGWDPDHIAMVQALPDDSVRQWDLLTMYGHDMGGVAPYYVKWADPSHHPTAKIPLDATLVSCKVVAPKDHDVHKLITGVGGIDIDTGAPTLECVIETPNGLVTFSASKPKGLVFPGYDEECF